MDDTATKMMNESVIKGIDPKFKRLLGTASHVALYNFTLQGWERSLVEGPLFVYSRMREPFYFFVILNRLSWKNLIEPITQDFELHLEDPYVYYRKSNGLTINGIWFYEKDDFEQIVPLLESVINGTIDEEKLSTKPHEINELNTFRQTMLYKAHAGPNAYSKKYTPKKTYRRYEGANANKKQYEANEGPSSTRNQYNQYTERQYKTYKQYYWRTPTKFQNRARTNESIALQQYENISQSEKEICAKINSGSSVIQSQKALNIRLNSPQHFSSDKFIECSEQQLPDPLVVHNTPQFNYSKETSTSGSKLQSLTQERKLSSQSQVNKNMLQYNKNIYCREYTSYEGRNTNRKQHNYIHGQHKPCEQYNWHFPTIFQKRQRTNEKSTFKNHETIPQSVKENCANIKSDSPVIQPQMALNYRPNSPQHLNTDDSSENTDQQLPDAQVIINTTEFNDTNKTSSSGFKLQSNADESKFGSHTQLENRMACSPISESIPTNVVQTLQFFNSSLPQQLYPSVSNILLDNDNSQRCWSTPPLMDGTNEHCRNEESACKQNYTISQSVEEIFGKVSSGSLAIQPQKTLTISPNSPQHLNTVDSIESTEQQTIGTLLINKSIEFNDSNKTRSKNVKLKSDAGESKIDSQSLSSHTELENRMTCLFLSESSPKNIVQTQPFLIPQQIFPTVSNTLLDDNTSQRCLSAPPLLEIPRKPTLMTPMMFTSTAMKKDEVSTSCTESILNLAPCVLVNQDMLNLSPLLPCSLTNKQIWQAVNYLRKTEPDFDTKLQEAYVKSSTGHN